MTRRDFGTILGGAVMGSMIGCSPARNNQSLEEYIQGQLASTGIPGCCGAICKGDKLIWSGGVGWADMEKKIPMTADTSMNIASVSKTVTAAAVMQLWDAELLQLDDDVSDYLPFPVKNPKHPTVPVTFRQLLTHRSSINDGPSYGVSYSCGDPAVSLHDWISGYFTIDGPYYDPEENFHEWEPGTLNPQGSSRAYSNVGFGLLGYLVESISKVSFSQYVHENIVHPLGMSDTGWFIGDVTPGKHATPYWRIPEGFSTDPGDKVSDYLGAENATIGQIQPGALFPHCIYSFFNTPDGLFRTNPKALSSFLRAMMNGGETNGVRILSKLAVETMLSDTHFGRKLCWAAYYLGDGRSMVAHSGGDPGVSTLLAFRGEEGIGVILMFNIDAPGEARDSILNRMYQEAEAQET